MKPPVDAEQEDTQDGVSTDSKTSGVKVPEEFQVKVAELLKGASREEVDYLQDECSTVMNEFYRKENESNFSTEDMPKD